jgi:hypothetical protein
MTHLATNSFPELANLSQTGAHDRPAGHKEDISIGAPPHQPVDVAAERTSASIEQKCDRRLACISI